MPVIKEITVFSVGDSNDLKTWSNVPFFFTKSLEEKGIRINRVNVEENALLNLIYKLLVYSFLKLLYKNSAHTYFRSGLNYFLTNRKIRRAIKSNSASDVFLFLTYSFSARQYTSKKIILFSDWSYFYLIKVLLKREPYWFEKKALEREKKHIEQADFVLSLFPQSLAFNKTNYVTDKCHYLGNVLNSNHVLNKELVLQSKQNSNKILFIGNKKYLKGAVDLVLAFKELPIGTECELHIIGLTEDETQLKLPRLFYYGYLDKGIPEQNNIYYGLLTNSAVIVNTTEGWGAFSAMAEAMYFYTPVITSAYGEFLETYGSPIDFGYYVKDNSIAELKNKLEIILTASPKDKMKMMQRAHEQVKDFTWENYAKNFLELVS